MGLYFPEYGYRFSESAGDKGSSALLSLRLFASVPFVRVAAQSSLRLASEPFSPAAGFVAGKTVEMWDVRGCLLCLHLWDRAILNPTLFG